MTDNEIIKALECCIDMECTKCPLNYDDCEERDFESLVKRAIPIFNRQKADYKLETERLAHYMKMLNFSIYDERNKLRAEIERLQYVLMGVMHSVDKWLEGDELKQDETNRAATMREKTLQIVEGKQAEVERLKAEIRNTDNILNLLDRPLVEIKSEAIKEFADRLKGYAKELKIGDNIYLQVVGVGRIDNLVKEMVGE